MSESKNMDGQNQMPADSECYNDCRDNTRDFVATLVQDGESIDIGSEFTQFVFKDGKLSLVITID